MTLSLLKFLATSLHLTYIYAVSDGSRTLAHFNASLNARRVFYSMLWQEGQVLNATKKGRETGNLWKFWFK